jgi:hypothetical protein
MLMSVVWALDLSPEKAAQIFILSAIVISRPSNLKSVQYLDFPPDQAAKYKNFQLDQLISWTITLQ